MVRGEVRWVLCEARPRVIAAAALHAESEENGALEISWARVRAVSMAGVRGLGPKPVVLVDIFLDGGGMERPLSLLRLRSDQFDPRALLADAPKHPLEALCAAVQAMIRSGKALALPDAEGAAGRPMRVYESLEAYEVQVLRPAAQDLA